MGVWVAVIVMCTGAECDMIASRISFDTERECRVAIARVQNQTADRATSFDGRCALVHVPQTTCAKPVRNAR